MLRLLSALLIILRANGEFRKIPENFLMGAVTTAYQIEGAWNCSDKGESIWDRFTHGTIPESTGDIACDSYHKYERDVEMLAEMGMNVYHFSIAWTRILPNGTVNYISQDGLGYYNRLIDALVRRNITPAVTMYHFDLPQALQDNGGFLNPAFVIDFTDYAQILFRNFGDRVKYWWTFNEPFNVCRLGYGTSLHAPGLKLNRTECLKCGHNLLKAHVAAYELYVERFKKIQNGKIGIGVDMHWYIPVTESALDRERATEDLQIELGGFVWPIYSKNGDYSEPFKRRTGGKHPNFTSAEIVRLRGSYDFIGLNYRGTVESASKYTHRFNPEYIPDSAIGLFQLLQYIKNEFQNPEIFITNIETHDPELRDLIRVDFYKNYINVALDALEDGCRIIGIIAKSLMDSFDWLEGYKMKYGLYYVDFEDPDRSRYPRTSAVLFKNLSKRRTIKRISRVYVL